MPGPAGFLITLAGGGLLGAAAMFAVLRFDAVVGWVERWGTCLRCLQRPCVCPTTVHEPASKVRLLRRVEER
jgi:hypothetical protein